MGRPTDARAASTSFSSAPRSRRSAMHVAPHAIVYYYENSSRPRLPVSHGALVVRSRPFGQQPASRRNPPVVEISYLQAIVIGVLQGVTELFPISSLGHSVLVPAWLGGSWSHLVTEYGTKESGQSPYLAFIVALHVATALALLWFFRRDWVAIIGAFFTTVRTRKVGTSTERLAWLIIIATIPVGVTGLLLE